MTLRRPFRFGIQAIAPLNAEGWVRLASQAENLGYSTLLLADHLPGVFAPVAALSVAATVTGILRVGSLVLNNDLRNPLVLANEVATLNAFSGGRVELGIGAGWSRADYEQSGVEYDHPRIRVARLAESITVLKGLLSGRTITFEGDFYHISGSVLVAGAISPIPFLIGGGGKSILTLAAREADIVGVSLDLRAGVVDRRVARETAATVLDRKVAWIREAAGQRFDEIEMNVLVYHVAVSDTGEAVASGPIGTMIAGQGGVGPYSLAGTIDEICSTIQVARDRWQLSYFVIPSPAVEAFAPVVQRLAGI